MKKPQIQLNCEKIIVNALIILKNNKLIKQATIKHIMNILNKEV